MAGFDRADLDLVGDAHLTFGPANGGEIAFIAVQGHLAVRYGRRDDTACAEFTWEGCDEGDPVNGRGWATLGTADGLIGHIFFENGDDYGLACERARGVPGAR